MTLADNLRKLWWGFRGRPGFPWEWEKPVEKVLPQVTTRGMCCSVKCNTQWQQQLREAVFVGGVSNIYDHEGVCADEHRCPACYHLIKETIE